MRLELRVIESKSPEAIMINGIDETTDIAFLGREYGEGNWYVLHYKLESARNGIENAKFAMNVGQAVQRFKGRTNLKMLEYGISFDFMMDGAVWTLLITPEEAAVFPYNQSRRVLMDYKQFNSFFPE